MGYALIKDGVVIQVDCHDREGFEWIEGVVFGMLYDGEMLSNPPTPEKSLLEQLAELDNAIPIHTRDAALLGDSVAIAKMQAVEDEKQALRDQL